MTRTIQIQLNVAVPYDDDRDTAEIVGAIETVLELDLDDSMRKLKIETIHAKAILEEQTAIYTVHPFDDEWTWDPSRSGAYPWATSSLREAIDHANLLRLEYASTEGVEEDWIAGFWSAIYEDPIDLEQSARADSMVGYVDPQGNYHEGADPPIDEGGDWKGEK